MNSHLVVLALCMIAAFLLGIGAAVVFDLAFEDAFRLAKNWWRTRSKGSRRADIQRPPADADPFFCLAKPLIRHWTLRILEDGSVNLVEMERDAWIDYNPKEQWAEERNQNCEYQRLKEVKG